MALAFASALAPGAGALPDGRQWELVSPSEKHGGRLEALTNEGGLIQAAAGGGAFAYVSQAPIVAEPEGNPSVAYSQQLAVRRAVGAWDTADLATPHDAPTGVQVGSASEYFAFTDDLSSALVEQPRSDETPLAVEPGEAKPEKTPYVRASLLEAGTRQYQRLLGASDVGPAVKYGNEVEALAGNPDLSSVVITATTSLIEGEPEAGLYEWDTHGATRLKPVSILPEGTPVSFTGAFLGRGNRNMRHAVSTDGTKVVWTGGQFLHEHLYVRDTSTGVTTQVDAAVGVAEPANARAYFQDATPNGERVFFTDTEKLTPDAGAESPSQDLYEFNTVSKALRDLTPASGGGGNADVVGNVLGVSEDGSYVYFVANGVLAAGAALGGCEKREGGTPEPGATCNLYEWHSGVTKLIAILSSEDARVWQGQGQALPEDLLVVTSRVSPSGRFLAFMSSRNLTGYDNRDAVSGVPDEEVFEFQAKPGAERLVCVSCNPSGARPHGVLDTEASGEGIGLLVDRPQSWNQRWLAASVPGYTAVTRTRAVYQARYLLDDGRLFFSSADGLSPADTNGKEDVYAFEPPGIGTCSAASPDYVGSSGGCVALISSGSSPKESAFLDASASGDDVFFLSAAALTSNDIDSAYDVYDSHVCSLTLPCAGSRPASFQPCSSNDSCQGRGEITEGAESAPATEAMVGPGNLKPAGGPVVKPPTRAQRLAKALKACRTKYDKRKREACERQARKRYSRHSKPASHKRGN